MTLVTDREYSYISIRSESGTQLTLVADTKQAEISKVSLPTYRAISSKLEVADPWGRGGQAFVVVWQTG